MGKLYLLPYLSIIYSCSICYLQGLGLFAARDLEKHTMVIEYIGQLIRNEVAEMREKIYEKQVIIYYLFAVSFSIFCMICIQVADLCDLYS